MHWIAPTEKDTTSATLEKRLWDAADQFRANSGLKAQEYSGPILGLIFLRFAEVRFSAQRARLSSPLPTGEGQGVREPGREGVPSRRGSRVDEPAAYHAKGVLYLSPESRFDYLLALPEATDIGGKVNAAMRDIEKHNPQLAGVLPKTYNLFTSTLLKELFKKVSEIPASVDYDAFGRIYEYFLGEFARTEGQKGGEFYTPSSIVKLLTEIIEPFHGRILDPACGSGGMFVQSARFVAEHKNLPSPSGTNPPGADLVGRSPPEGFRAGWPGNTGAGGEGAGDEGAQYSGDPARELSIHGVEKTDETGRLCRLNLAIHGLEGDIRHGGQVNSYYDDPHDACSPLPLDGAGDEGGRFDFVLANPPFNVNAVDKQRLKDMTGPGRRYPFGLPRTDNANYLWIQLFYSSLNLQGRAGFVMANSASDARASEQEIRQKLIQSRAVDVMVAVGPNMFYNVTLPCTLWFLDKSKSYPRPLGGKGQGEGVSRADTVLFIDARHIYRQVDRAHRDWTPAQIGFLANIVRLYRGEAPDFTLGGEEAKAKLAELFSPARQTAVAISAFSPSPSGRRWPVGPDEGDAPGLSATVGIDTKHKDIPAETIAFARQLRQQQTDAENLVWQLLRDRRLGGYKFRCQHPLPPYVADFYCHEARLCVELDGGQHALQQEYDEGREADLQAQGVRTLRFWNNQVLTETETVLETVWQALHDASALTPNPSPAGRGEQSPLLPPGEGRDEGALVYRDIPGLCKAATLKEIEAQGWSLNPGRYVGVAPGEEVSDEDLKEQLEELNEELESLNAQARELEQIIAANVAQILEV